MSAAYQARKLMPTLVIRSGTPVSPRGMSGTVQRFVQDVEAAEKRAAQTATQATVNALGANRRPRPPQRKGRSQANALSRVLLWKPSKNGAVEFDLGRVDAQNKYWVIQEVGTNSRAVMKRGGAPNPRGQVPAGSTFSRPVRSQVGRLISTRLAWGDTGGNFMAPGPTAQDQQLYLVSQLAKVPQTRSQLVIGKEITGRHFVQAGGRAGFRAYRASVLAAARQAFGRNPKP